MWSLLLVALAGLLIGGAVSFHKQGLPRLLTISFVVLAAMSFLAAYLLTLTP